MERIFWYRRTKLRNVLIVLIIVALVGIGFMIYQYLRNDKAVISPGKLFSIDPPKFMFHIYGDDKERLLKPLDVDVDTDGTIFVVDYSNREIKVFDEKGDYHKKFNNIGPVGSLEGPVGIAVANNRVYVADALKNQIYEFKTNGKFQRTLITSKLKRQLIGVRPCGVTVAQNGDIYFTDILYHRIVVLNQAGELKTTLGVAGDKEGALAYPNDLALDNKGKVFVSDSNNYRVQLFDETTGTGKLFAAPDGKQVLGGLTRGIAVDEKGQVWVVDAIGHRVKVFDKKGSQLFGLGEFGSGDGEFNFPNGIAVKNNRIYVADRENNRISIFGY